MEDRTLGYRAPLLWLVLPAIAGLATGSATGVRQATGPLVAAVLSAALALASANHPRRWACSLALALFCAGAVAGVLQRNRLAAWDPLPAREANQRLRIDRIFPSREPGRTSGLAEIVTADPHVADLRGQNLHFSLSRAEADPTPVRGAIFAAIGVLTTLPENPAAGTFEDYLAAAGMNFRMNRGRLLTEESPAPTYYRFCAAAAARFRAILDLGLVEKRPELAALLRGMMLGEKHEITEEQQAVFMRSGTMHLFAISGLNIGVIAVALQALLTLARVPRWPRFLVATALLWMFVDITGGSPSAVRAWFMATFLQAAFVLRRPGNVLAAMVASAAASIVLSPLQVFSASFVMSYAIVLALLLLGLPLAGHWQRTWSPWREVPEVAWTRGQRLVLAIWSSGSGALAIGLATTLVSVLTGIHYFQLITPGALIANLALLPAASGVTVAGFASLLFGLCHLDWATILANHAAALLLLLIERGLQAGVQVPGMFLTARYTAPWIGQAALMLLVATVLHGYARGWRREAGGWWPPFAVVAATLVAGVRYGSD
ncbi:MAG: ComEC/Rec2 family competence protein [Opitutaceae bacterium]